MRKQDCATLLTPSSAERTYNVLVEFAHNPTFCTWEVELTENEARTRAALLKDQHGRFATVSIIKF